MIKPKEKVIKWFSGRFDVKKLVDLTKDEGWVKKALKGYDLPGLKPPRGIKRVISSNSRTRFYYS